MQRTKEWWARLTKYERSELVWLERANTQLGRRSIYLPDDCQECPSCSRLSSGGLCKQCDTRLLTLIHKASGEKQTGSAQV